jgi:importin subunit alpha-1
LVQTACFALSNLARGPNAHLEEFFEAGIAPKLASHLINNTPDTVTEICWVLSYLTAGTDQFIGKLLDEGIAPLLVQNLGPLQSQGPLALPLIRTCGNIASGPDDYTDILINEEPFLPGIIALCQSDCRPVKKEALWVLSNITASRRPQVLEKVIQAGAIPVLTEIASHTNFDIRKEAAFSLTNIACHGDRYIQALPNNILLPGID